MFFFLILLLSKTAFAKKQIKKYVRNDAKFQILS